MSEISETHAAAVIEAPTGTDHDTAEALRFLEELAPPDREARRRAFSALLRALLASQGGIR